MPTTVPQGQIFGRSEGDSFIPPIWSTEIFRYRMEQLVLARYLKRIAFNGGHGDYIRMAKINRLGVNPKLPKTPVTYQATAGGKWEMRIDTYKEASIMVEDILAIQAQTDLRSEYTKELGVAMARDIDNTILGYRAAFAGVSGSHITTAGPLDDAKILAAIEVLDVRRVPKQGRVLVIAPSQQADLLSSASKFTQNIYTTETPLTTGVVGQVYGIPVVVSDNIGVNSATGFFNGDEDPTPSPTPGMSGSLYYPTQFDISSPSGLPAGRWSAMLMSPDSLAIGMVKMPNVETARDIDYQSWKVVTTQIYGVKPYREDGTVIITTD